MYQVLSEDMIELVSYLPKTKWGFKPKIQL